MLEKNLSVSLSLLILGTIYLTPLTIRYVAEIKCLLEKHKAKLIRSLR